MKMRHSSFILVCVFTLNVAATAQDQNIAGVEMTTYYIGFLRSGPKRGAEGGAAAEEIQEAHMAHIRGMGATGKLVGAGPFGDDGRLRGIFIFKTGSLDEARAMAEADPAVKAGRLVVDLHPWLAPKGIGAKHSEAKKKNPEAKDEMVVYQLALLGRGPGWTAASTPANERLQADHMAYVIGMIKSGRFVAAGPLTDGGDTLGLIVIEAASADEAKALIDNDPKVKTGHLVYELHPWWTAKGVMP